ncbi:hypothetical protein ACFP81_06375 [Deinococcus lacus]|uniref:Uncharacterized protein n=1 Tax=Deinococcus lacus TaxID=392561 RepID=A0ABW1YBK4_9DEIO
MLRYHWSKLDKEARAELAKPDTGEGIDPQTMLALERFYAEYGLPEFQVRRPITSQARADLRRAMDARRVPSWVLAMVLPGELD